MKPIRVVVWGENVHEHKMPAVAEIYPNGMHTVIGEGISELLAHAEVSTATLQEPDHGLSKERLAETDVLVWWGHCAHGDVEDRIVDRVQQRVLQGMGLIVLHSGHFAKIFKRLLGTSCSLTWREIGERERIWVCNPGHPIAQGLERHFELAQEEMYGEPFAIPHLMNKYLSPGLKVAKCSAAAAAGSVAMARFSIFVPGMKLTRPTSIRMCAA